MTVVQVARPIVPASSPDQPSSTAPEQGDRQDRIDFSALFDDLDMPLACEPILLTLAA